MMRKEFQVLGWGEVLWNKEVKTILDTCGPLLHPGYSYQESGEKLGIGLLTHRRLIQLLCPLLSPLPLSALNKANPDSALQFLQKKQISI